MPTKPVDLKEIEQDILEAAVEAAGAITERLIRLWPGEYKDSGRREPVVFDAFEHVVQFETACRLRERLVERERSWRYVSWEHQYEQTAGSGILDLIVSPTQAHADLAERLAVEVKWMSEARGGVTGAASDALKLVWASASARYLLLFGRHDRGTLIGRIIDAANDDRRMKGRLTTRSWVRELRQARSILVNPRDSMALVDHQPLASERCVSVALVRVPGAPDEA